jgi:hypothetical protein
MRSRGRNCSAVARWRSRTAATRTSAGEPIGTDNIRLKLRLERRGAHFVATFESNIRDNTGAVVFTARGTISGERIEV